MSSDNYSQFFPLTPEVLCQIQMLPTSTQQKVREFCDRILFGNHETVRKAQMKCVQVFMNRNADSKCIYSNIVYIYILINCM